MSFEIAQQEFALFEARNKKESGSILECGQFGFVKCVSERERKFRGRGAVAAGDEGTGGVSGAL